VHRILPHSASPSTAPAPVIDASAEGFDASQADAHPSAPRRRHIAALAIVGFPLLIAAVLTVVWRGTPEAPAPVQREAAFDPPPHSVAVLAFTNLSGDPAQEYFSDGLSEELIDGLGRIEGLRVPARQSSFSFKGKSATAGEIARRLNVGAVLEGSVRRDGKRLRVTAQLIDAATGYQLWSRSFDRDQTDILQVQGEIAEAVTRSLRVSLMGDESARLTLGESANPAAVDAYLRGLKLQNSDNEVPDHAHEAMAAFDEAIRLDPGYALAEVGRAYSFLSLAAWGPDQPDFKTLFQHALTAANRAVALAPALGAAHAARACALAYTLAFAEAAAEYKTAMDLSPNDVEVKMSYSNFEVSAGHFARGLEAVQQAVNLDPLQPAVYTAMAWSLMLARRYDEALVAQRHARLLMNDGNARHSGQLGYVELLEGDAQSARRDCEAGHDWLQVACLAMAYHALGRQGEAEAQLARLHGMMGDSGAYNYATIYAQWGRTADALRWLGTAFQLHDSGLAILRVDPMLDPIRGTPEYKEIEKRLTLSP
jgi:TolB-like protein/Flp pilus assembly protein TadD